MALPEKITRNVDSRYWYPEEDSFPVKNRYTAGIAGQKFFEELRDNAKIYGTYCSCCNLTYVPARLFCERCLERLEDWIDVGTTGTVFSYTAAYLNLDGSAREEPHILAAIKIADGILLHRLEECSLKELEIGREVEAVFKPREERNGNILDIRYFKLK